MIGTDTLEVWATKGHFTDWERKIERAHGIRAEIVYACQQIPAGETWTTTDLVKYLHPDASQKARDYWCNGSQYMRKHGHLAGVWRYGKPNARTFGKPAVHWINPSAPPPLEDEPEIELEDLLK